MCVCVCARMRHSLVHRSMKCHSALLLSYTQFQYTDIPQAGRATDNASTGMAENYQLHSSESLSPHAHDSNIHKYSIKQSLQQSTLSVSFECIMQCDSYIVKSN